MEKRAIYQITNVSKINNLSKNASFEACLCCILEQDFKYNKYIHPDTLQILKNKYNNFKINFKDNHFNVNGEKYNISYQLKCAYYILKYLKYSSDDELSDYFFESDNKYGLISKNIKVEITKPGILDDENRYRVDLEFILNNGYKIIIEINENTHEDDGKKIKELIRARQILDDDKKICKFYIIREKFIGNNYKKIKKFVKKELVPFIKQISLLHDEKLYVVNKLVQLTFEEWRPICNLIYESHLTPKKPIISINQLIDFFDMNWSDDYIKVVDELIDDIIIGSTNLSDCEDSLSDCDDLLSDCELSDDDEQQDIIIKETKDDYYVIKDDNIKLTWKGFNTYLTYIIRYMKNIKKTKKINEFNYKIHTEFVNVIKEQRNQLLNITESSKIWGYRDDDYSYSL